MHSRPPIKAFFSAVTLALAACSAGQAGGDEPAKPRVGWFSTLPIYWGESDDFTAMLDGDSDKDWAREVLEQRFALAPVDALEPEMLAGVDRLMLAQPRALAPSENVALDEWLRGGGRLLIFADPLLTRHSEYPIGDRRRPQDVVLLSPILARWGLELQFDEDQPEGERWEKAYDGNFPVNLAGRFAIVEGSAPAECMVSNSGILAQCQVGNGRVTLLADAAILDWDGPGEVPANRTAALDSLVAAALDF